MTQTPTLKQKAVATTAAAAAVAAAVGAGVLVKKVTPYTPPPYVKLYDGLFYAEMGTLREALQSKSHVTEEWHDAQENETNIHFCFDYFIGHSMGGNAALRQAARCATMGRPPKAVITIDPGRAPLEHTCPPKIPCINYYDPSHPIGGQYVNGAKNIVVPGYDHLQLPSVPSVVKGVLAVVTGS